jgi:endonuclease/exonuclease/phosphatase family metal-dependent hydrolase
VRVLTWNVLHSSVRGRFAPWSRRRPIVVAALRAAEPDLACLQEVSTRQLADLERDLPEFELLGGPASGRSTLTAWALGLALAAAAGSVALNWRAAGAGARGGMLEPLRGAAAIVALLALAGWLGARFLLGDWLERGEHLPILLRRGRFTPLASGGFWISRRPDTAASRLPASPTPHLVTWARVRAAATGWTCTCYSVHLGLVPWHSAATARILLERLDRDWDGGPQLVAGDFNAPPHGALISALLAARAGAPPALRDAWPAAARREGEGGTMRWSAGAAAARIDYVLVRGAPAIASAAVLAAASGGEAGSDHAALVVELEPGASVVPS